MHAHVRPRIEKRLAEAIDLMREKEVFETDKEGNPTWKRLEIAEEPATVLFHSRRSESGTRYFPTIKHNNVRIDFMFRDARSEENTSELQSLIRNSNAVFCWT